MKLKKSQRTFLPGQNLMGMKKRRKPKKKGKIGKNIGKVLTRVFPIVKLVIDIYNYFN